MGADPRVRAAHEIVGADAQLMRFDRCIFLSNRVFTPVPTQSRAERNQKKRNKTHTRNVPGAFLRTGAIPESVGGLSSLKTLDLALNGLSGMSV